jgi:CheY-like chemotaxis protein
MPLVPKKVLFVDDDLHFLETLQELMGHYAGANWEIHLANEAAQALAVLAASPVDLLVIDVHMPVMDGLQFLGLLHRKYPNLPKVVLTGDASEPYRSACLNGGAELFLEKPRAQGGWQSVYATLNELTRMQPEEGFRGVLRRVGLQDVLQMECLGRNSSMLEIVTGDVRGKIFIEHGQIIHAAAGPHKGEEAFNYLLTLAGGALDLKPFVEPPERSITRSWEFLLMEAARQRDEASEAAQSALPTGQPPAASPAERPGKMLAAPNRRPAEAASTGPPVNSTPDQSRPQIEEVLICAPPGEVLYEWQCANTRARIDFMNLLTDKARAMAEALSLGTFERLEIEGPNSRIIAQVQPTRALFVRTSQAGVENASPRKA